MDPDVRKNKFPQKRFFLKKENFLNRTTASRPASGALTPAGSPRRPSWTGPVFSGASGTGSARTGRRRSPSSRGWSGERRCILRNCNYKGNLNIFSFQFKKRETKSLDLTAKRDDSKDEEKSLDDLSAHMTKEEAEQYERFFEQVVYYLGNSWVVEKLFPPLFCSAG